VNGAGRARGGAPLRLRHNEQKAPTAKKRFSLLSRRNISQPIWYERVVWANSLIRSSRKEDASLFITPRPPDAHSASVSLGYATAFPTVTEGFVNAMGALRRALTALARTRPTAAHRGFATNINQTYGAPAETFKRKVRPTCVAVCDRVRLRAVLPGAVAYFAPSRRSHRPAPARGATRVTRGPTLNRTWSRTWRDD